MADIGRAIRVLALAGILFCVAPPARSQEEPLITQSSAELELARKKAEPPRLTVAPSHLRAEVERGGRASARLTVSNAGGRTLTWRVASLPKGVRVSPGNGSLGFEERQSVALSFDAEGLAPGAARGAVVVEAQGADGSPASVSVEFAVTGSRTWHEPEPRREHVTSGDLAGRFGLRIGSFLPVQGDQADAGASTLLGASYSFGGPRERRVSYELAAEVGLAETVGEYESRPLSGAFNVIIGSTGNGSTRGYLAAGAGGLIEFVNHEATGAKYTNYVGTLNLGTGVVLADGRLDLRVGYTVLLGAENAPGRGQVGIGFAF